MSSLTPSALASLDDALVLPFESVEYLRAGKSIDLAEIIQELETAAESGQALRALVSAEFPEASWQSRAELEALLEKTQQKGAEQAGRSEQLHSPPVIVATETELVPDAVASEAVASEEWCRRQWCRRRWWRPAPLFLQQSIRDKLLVSWWVRTHCFMEIRSPMCRWSRGLRLIHCNPGSAE